MKKAILAVCFTTATVLCAQAQVTVLNVDFSTYSPGTLVGQNGWLQTSTTTTNPIQIAGGQAVLGTSGQDVYDGFSSSVTVADGQSLTTEIQLSITSVQAGGDYFFHLSDPLGTASNFYQRLFAKSTSGGFLFGLVDTSGTGSTITYGTTVLSLSTSYDVVIVWNFVAGALNDTFSVSVDGTNYLNHTWTSALAEPTSLAAVNFRQGSSSNAAGALVDSILVTSSVPEPQGMALAVAGLLGLVVVMRGRMRRA